MIIFGANYFSPYLPPSNCWIFWDKKGDIAFQNPFADGELIYTSFKKPVKKIVFRQQGFITDSKDKRFHPTQKPVALYEWILTKFAADGDKILDTHVGSASSLIACRNTGHDFIGFELSKHYYKVSKERYEQETAQMRITDFL